MIPAVTPEAVTNAPAAGLRRRAGDDCHVAAFGCRKGRSRAAVALGEGTARVMELIPTG